MCAYEHADARGWEVRLADTARLDVRQGPGGRQSTIWWIPALSTKRRHSSIRVSRIRRGLRQGARDRSSARAVSFDLRRR